MDITERLRSTRASMLGTLDDGTYAAIHEAADEIDRLRAELAAAPAREAACRDARESIALRMPDSALRDRLRDRQD